MKTETLKQVLLVEDDKIAQKMARFNLEAGHCQVDSACSGQEALAFDQQKVYELIFMDLGLDDMSGYEVAKKIRESSENNQNTFIVALSANIDDEIKQLCITSGMNDFIEKPINSDKLQILFEKLYGQDC